MDSILELVCHPQTSARSVQKVSVSVRRDRRSLDVSYAVECRTDLLHLPPPQKPYRAEGLWRTTCFELFVHDTPPSYREFNFSPSSQWAAYGFSSYRQDMDPLSVDAPPAINLWDEGYALILTTFLEISKPGPMSIGLSAVIEETDGTKSWWALAHPDPDRPDFHHPDSFTLRLDPAAD